MFLLAFLLLELSTCTIHSRNGASPISYFKNVAEIRAPLPVDSTSAALNGGVVVASSLLRGGDMSKAGYFSKSPWWGPVSFGGLPRGRSLKTNPKTRRPLSARSAIHLVMRSEVARGRFNMRNGENLRFVQRALTLTARRYRIKLHRTANVGNHLHILSSAKNRRFFICFTRQLATVIACELTLARRPGEPFWTGRPFTRIVFGGTRGFWRTDSYVILNELEAVGILPPRSLARLGPAGFGRRMRLLEFARKVAVAEGFA